MAESKRTTRHPPLPFWVVKCEEETGYVYVTAAEITDIRRAARFHVTELLERPDFLVILARMPTDHVERVKAFAAKMSASAQSQSRQIPGAEVFVRELVSADGEYCTVHRGSMAALVAAGLATVDQMPTGVDGDKTWTKSGGYAGSGKNPSQRWKVRRLRQRRHLFEVYRWHEKRPVESSFQRFMLRAMQPAP